MNVLNHLKGNFILSSTAIGVGLFSKHFLKKEFIPVSSTSQITKSYFFILGTTIVGKLVMDKFYESHWIPYSAGGKSKVENEGFIGPLHGDLLYLFTPNRKPNTPPPSSSRWDPNIHKN